MRFELVSSQLSTASGVDELGGQADHSWKIGVVQIGGRQPLW